MILMPGIAVFFCKVRTAYEFIVSRNSSLSRVRAMRLWMEIKNKRGTDSDSLCELTGIDYPRCSFLLGTLESAGVISRDVIGGCFINAIFD